MISEKDSFQNEKLLSIWYPFYYTNDEWERFFPKCKFYDYRLTGLQTLTRILFSMCCWQCMTLNVYIYIKFLVVESKVERNPKVISPVKRSAGNVWIFLYSIIYPFYDTCDIKMNKLLSKL